MAPRRHGNPKRLRASYNRNGGLTLVPLPRFVGRAQAIAHVLIEQKGLPTDIAAPEFSERASGEPFVRLGKDHVGGHDCVVLASGPLTWELLGQLQLVLYYLSGRRAQRIAIVLMYLPWSRSEKPEGDKELALTPALVLFLKNATGFSDGGVSLDRIIAADLHASAIGGFGGRPGLITEVSFTRRLLQQGISDARQEFGNGNPKVCILYADATAQTRYEWAVAKACSELGVGELPWVTGPKGRVSSHHSYLRGLYGDLDALHGSVVVSVDDEMATGGTNDKAAAAIINTYQPRCVWSTVTHGVLCAGAPALLANPDRHIARVYMADTILHEPRPELVPLIKAGTLRVVPCLDDWANIIRFHHLDINLREQR